MAWLDRLFGKREEPALALYQAVVAQGRAEHWYLEGGVPDTLDGRFDMIATVLAVTLLRIEREDATLGVQLTERFVDDMDAQLREIGIGDIVVGKHIGKMMAMLGGRLGAFRDADGAGELDAALVRNLYRGAHPGPAALAHVRAGLDDWRRVVEAAPLDQLARGAL